MLRTALVGKRRAKSPVRHAEAVRSRSEAKRRRQRAARAGAGCPGRPLAKGLRTAPPGARTGVRPRDSGSARSFLPPAHELSIGRGPGGRGRPPGRRISTTRIHPPPQAGQRFFPTSSPCSSSGVCPLEHISRIRSNPDNARAPEGQAGEPRARRSKYRVLPLRDADMHARWRDNALIRRAIRNRRPRAQVSARGGVHCERHQGGRELRHGRPRRPVRSAPPALGPAARGMR